MMREQPDKLFREKLYGHQHSVSPDAWKRVSQNLRNKRQRTLLFRVAAAVLLLATGTLLIYPSVTNNTAEQVTASKSEKTPPTTPDRRAAEPANKMERPAGNDNLADNTNSRPRTDRPQRVQKSDSQKISGTKVTRDTLPAPAPLSPPQPVENVPGNIREKSEDSATGQMLASTAPRKPVTIIFTAEEVNQKYLAKAPGTEATSEAESPSGLRKLLDKAQDFTQNQDLMGSLRQMKDEIFAMNFRGDRQSPQND